MWARRVEPHGQSVYNEFGEMPLAMLADEPVWSDRDRSVVYAVAFHLRDAADKISSFRSRDVN